ncbi:hypothetical protein DW708_04345 [Ruminococcus sp. AM27-11LB]|uniref:hypothetical protein n=1 Tax=Mediterraneibacter TaxID=2316020 RepID=UPI000E495C0D|nr:MULTISPECIES: hypothetical protein [Mediterraneibacter]RGH94378.1 hypothetical protein DW719_05495 [Ruminococcus sp. AM27-27]RGH96785.1 hypothetical protein DW708_04345 [Ruminococcus sp. AM27-11LB]
MEEKADADLKASAFVHFVHCIRTDTNMQNDCLIDGVFRNEEERNKQYENYLKSVCKNCIYLRIKGLTHKYKTIKILYAK